eukprot:TRINITY_DN101576_c0_g1_i1.p1 TRINITY_DN101576_c0_g1~~TRINITY_DN101576_c0_g1_i1.p1  ORF type:complete len:377 (+),score=64.47 TRINITY_DN101576_c0_g1_i1:112-1242(+)
MGQQACTNCTLGSGEKVELHNAPSREKYGVSGVNETPAAPKGTELSDQLRIDCEPVKDPEAAIFEPDVPTAVARTEASAAAHVPAPGKAGLIPSNQDAHGTTESYSTSYFGREAGEFASMPRQSATERTRRRHEFKTGSVYEGQWLGNARDGFGKQMWPDGATFEGEWRDNAANGKGRFKHADGDEYIGEWQNNTAHGSGTYRHRDTTEYVGQFLDDLQDGCGVESWPDKSRYVGQFRHGKKSGHGIYEWPDGSTYTGQWDANQIDGVGAYVGADERHFDGRWHTSTMHGCGRYQWPDGRSYRGQYVWDQKDGFGIFQWADGRRYEGFWSAGRQHGLGRLCHETGGQRLAEWCSGERVAWLEEEQKANGNQAVPSL